MTLYNIFLSSGTTSFDHDWAIVAIDRILLDKIVEAYLRGINSIKHNGITYEITSYYFQIYEIFNERKYSAERLTEIYHGLKKSHFNGYWDERIFSETGKNVTAVFLKGRDWGDLKEDLYNLYYESKEKLKHLVIALSKEQIESFLSDWKLGLDPIFIDGRSLDMGTPKSLRIFDVNFQYLTKTRGELKREIRRSLRNLYHGDIKMQLLEDFGNDVSSDFNILPFGSNSQSTIKNEGTQHDWRIIHPVIVKYAKPRYESNHFADAVEAAYKELNEVIKKEYLKSSQSELDGAKLMRTVFTPSNPKFRLLNIVSESERNIQEGYMSIFAGVMIGIRNPKAHSNIEIDQQDAWEKIVIASHLMKMWDNRIKEVEKSS